MKGSSQAARWLASSKSFWAQPRVRDFSTNTVWALTAYVTMVGIEKLIVMPFLGRQLSETAFGVLVLGRNTATVFASGLFAGLHNLLLRRNQEWQGSEKACAVRGAALLGASLAMAELVFLLLVLLARGEAGWLRAHATVVAAFAVWGVASVLNHLWQTYWRMQFRLAIFYGLQIFNGLALLLVVPCYWLAGETGIYWGWIVAGLAPLFATWLASRAEADWQGGARYLSWAELGRMLREMWVFVWGVIGQSLFQNLDRFIIGGLLGAAAVSTYFKVTNTAYLVVVPVEPLSGVLLSMVAQERVSQQTMTHLRRLHALMLVVIAGVVILGTLLGRPLTDLLYGAGTFASGSRLYWIVLAGGAFAIVSILLRGMLIVYVPARWIVWHDTLSLLVLAASSGLLTWLYGLTGTAAAVTLALAFRALLSEAVVWLAVYRKLESATQA
jgi:O-antigen/teichoic acid export membrane protein